ncbi:BZ3500_MvSof-1268-A1-R1_Chr8-1g10007 [Microbotryum saponariae]|uniref:BZ3500_MvSof-1268-A1-R1_Chr8-1g10007 protein n=1 Tax=Microbotryum saponariae TaxID=289078 RepID=A0A2X0M806_9BASI|nr:BZ3500_MvSof-1268-A1-R1_Chr8-1g10007 [Microbotryum saponariae]SDA08293.1 BZ3501_MvSof-1269-A2-R1_Chr8-1g09730 [Microbotryum saponariae]
MATAAGQTIASMLEPRDAGAATRQSATAGAGAGPSTSTNANAGASTTDLTNSEFVETRSVTLDWKVTNLKVLFESSKGDTKSKCVKVSRGQPCALRNPSALFDNHRWQVFLYPNSGVEQYVSLYLSCEPTAAEKERGAAERAGWSSSNTTTSPPSGSAVGGAAAGRQSGGSGALSKDVKADLGSSHALFQARTVDRRMTFKQMEANDHSFSDSARNWGYANFWKRSDAYYNNPQVRLADAFLISCTIVYSPTPPTPPPLPRLLIPKDLVAAYAAMFDDPDYSDVVFRIRPSNRPNVREKRLYAAKKILAGRCEYFDTMFNSGFHESSLAHVSPITGGLKANSSPSQFAELDDEDELDFSESDNEEDDDWDEDDDSDVDDSQADDASDEDAQSDGAAPEVTQTDLSASLPRRDGGSIGQLLPAQTVGMDRGNSSSSSVGGQQSGPSMAIANQPRSDHGSRPSSAAVSDDEGERLRCNDDTHRALSDSDEGAEDGGNRTLERAARASRDGGALTFVDAPVAPESPVKPAPTKKARPDRRDEFGSKARSRAVDSRPRFEVVVTDAAYHSYRALLHYLYTDSITFAPLASTYHVARDAALAFDTPFPFSSRRAYLLANTPWPQSKGGAGPCSAKAMYRLADKLGLPELKERAYEHIVKSLTAQNIPYEVFGSFAARFDEIKRVEIAFLLERWNDIKASHGLRKVFAFIRGNRFPGFEEVWLRIIDHLEVKMTPGIEGDDMRI